MANFANLSFETAGASAGLAASWTLTTTATYDEILGFDTDTQPYEDFERGWSSNQTAIFAFEPAHLSALNFDNAVIYTPEAVEDFEEGWSNDTYLTELSGGTVVTFDGENFEDFEEQWSSNQSYLFSFGGGDVTALTFDTSGTPEAVEDFEEGWKGNENYVTTLAGNEATVMFDTGGEAFEDFENNWSLTL